MSCSGPNLPRGRGDLIAGRAGQNEPGAELSEVFTQDQAQPNELAELRRIRSVDATPPTLPVTALADLGILVAGTPAKDSHGPT